MKKYVFGLRKFYDEKSRLTYLRVDIGDKIIWDMTKDINHSQLQNTPDDFFNFLKGKYRGNVDEGGYNLVSESDIDLSEIISALEEHGFELSPEFICGNPETLYIEPDQKRCKKAIGILKEWEKEMRKSLGLPYYRFKMDFPEDIQEKFRNCLGTDELNEFSKPDSYFEVFIWGEEEEKLYIMSDGFYDRHLEDLNPKLQDAILDAIENKKYI